MNWRNLLLGCVMGVGASSLAAGCGMDAGHAGSGGGTTIGSTGTRATVEGRVRAGPTCPVEQAGHPCPLVAVRGALVTAHDENGAVLASTRTGSRGVFTLTLAPGRYRLLVTTGSMLPRCNPVTVSVGPHEHVHIDINCDTGIR